MGNSDKASSLAVFGSIGPRRGIERSVLSLFLARSPLAVAGFVVAVVVDTLKRIALGWHGSHVFKEISKRVGPTTADHDATSTIATEMREMRVQASTSHAGPATVFGRSSSVRRLAPKGIGGTTFASATGASPIPQCLPNDFTLHATTANAKPDCLIVAARRRCRDKPAPKLLANKVHDIVRGGVCFHFCSIGCGHVV
jgi:hypothetical protein